MVEDLLCATVVCAICSDLGIARSECLGNFAPDDSEICATKNGYDENDNVFHIVESLVMLAVTWSPICEARSRSEEQARVHEFRTCEEHPMDVE